MAVEPGNHPGVWKPPWSLETTLQKCRADSFDLEESRVARNGGGNSGGGT
jgi:hypothetical protein